MPHSRLLLILAALVGLFAFSGCGGNSEPEVSLVPQRERLTLAYVLPDNDRFHRDLWLFYTTQSAPLGIDTTRIPLADGADAYAAALREALESDPDMLIIAPPTDAATQTLVQSAINEGITVFLLGDRPGEPLEGVAATVLVDDSSAVDAMATALAGEQIILFGEEEAGPAKRQLDRLTARLGGAIVATASAADTETLSSLAQRHPEATWMIAATQGCAQQLVDNQSDLAAWANLQLAGIDLVVPPQSTFPLDRFAPRINNLPNAAGRALAEAVIAVVDEKPIENPLSVVEAAFYPGEGAGAE